MFARLSLALTFMILALVSAHACQEIDPIQEPEAVIKSCSDWLEKKVQANDAEKADALVKRGIAYRTLQEYGKSVEDIKASLALNRNTPSLRMLAWTYREMGNPTEAEKVFTQVLETDKHWQGWLSRCVVKQDLKRYAESIPDCEEALRQDPENLDAMFFAAFAYSNENIPEKSLPLTVRAMELAPYEPRHLVEHVWALHQLKRTSEARKKAAEGLTKFPQNSNLLNFMDQSKQN